jgi:hypothetical protein
MPIELPATRVRAELGREDSAWALDARAAWDSLTASGDAEWVTLYELQDFLWYRLPTKFLVPYEHKLAVASALAGLLDALGHKGHADLCRGAATIEVLDAWERSSTAGYAALRRAMERSGVDPPNVEDFKWGNVMGLEEAALHLHAAIVLEEAIGSGRLTPAAPGWKKAQSRVLKEFLDADLDRLHGGSPREAIRGERFKRWSERGQGARRSLLNKIRDRIREQPAAPPGATVALRPLIRLLELAADGVELTQKGYISPAIVAQLAGDFGWWDHPRPPRTETEVNQLRVVRAIASGAGLIRRARNRMVTTALGRRVRSDGDQLWSQVTSHFAEGSDFIAILRELLLARLLTGPAALGTVAQELLPSIQETGWRLVDGDTISVDAVRWSMWDAIRPLTILGMTAVGEWPNRDIALTDFGEPTAKEVLWRRATAPQSL